MIEVYYEGHPTFLDIICLPTFVAIFPKQLFI